MDCTGGESILYSASTSSDYNFQFTKGMKAQRSNMATHLCRHCAALFGVSESNMLQSDIQQGEIPRVHWVGR